MKAARSQEKKASLRAKNRCTDACMTLVFLLFMAFMSSKGISPPSTQSDDSLFNLTYSKLSLIKEGLTLLLLYYQVANVIALLISSGAQSLTKLGFDLS
jgi:hypothetical protein